MIEIPLTKNAQELINAVKEHSVIYCPMLMVDMEDINMLMYWNVDNFERFNEEVLGGGRDNRYVLRDTEYDFKILRDFYCHVSYKLSIEGDRFKLRKYYEKNEYKLLKRKERIKKVLG